MRLGTPRDTGGYVNVAKGVGARRARTGRARRPARPPLPSHRRRQGKGTPVQAAVGESKHGSALRSRAPCTATAGRPCRHTHLRAAPIVLLGKDLGFHARAPAGFAACTACLCMRAPRFRAPIGCAKRPPADVRPAAVKAGPSRLALRYSTAGELRLTCIGRVGRGWRLRLVREWPPDSRRANQEAGQPSASPLGVRAPPTSAHSVHRDDSSAGTRAPPRGQDHATRCC